MKRNLIIFIIILTVVLVGIFLYFLLDINKSNNIEDPSKIVTPNIETLLSASLGVSDCSDYKDIGTVVLSKDIRKCDCLTVDLQDECRHFMADEMFYNQAYYQADISLCEKMSYQTGREACVKVVTDQINFLKTDQSDLLMTYIFSGNYNSAIKLLENILQVQPTTANHHLLLAQSYAEKALSEYQVDIYIPLALAQIAEAKKIEPNNSDVYRIEGYVYEIKPDIDKALESYNQALVLDPNNISAYAHRGHAKELAGDLTGALVDFNQAASLDKNKQNIFTYANLCRFNFYLNKLDEAIKNCSIVISDRSLSPLVKSEVHQILGAIYSQIGNYDKARTQFKIAETYTPDSVNLKLAMAEMLVGEGQVVEAETYSRQVIAVDSNRAIAWRILATSLSLQNKNTEAIDSALQALTLVMDDVSLLLGYKSAEEIKLYDLLITEYEKSGDQVNQKKYQLLKENLI